MNNPVSAPRRVWGKRRFESVRSNELWQADFKQTEDDEWMIIYLGDHSRFIPSSKIRDLLYECKPKDCTMFLSDGGLAKTKTAKSVFAGLFTCDRWVLNFNDRVLTKLRPARKKTLTIDEVQGPIFEGAISYFAKRLKTGETTCQGANSLRPNYRI